METCSTKKSVFQLIHFPLPPVDRCRNICSNKTRLLYWSVGWHGFKLGIKRRQEEFYWIKLFTHFLVHSWLTNGFTAVCNNIEDGPFFWYLCGFFVRVLRVVSKKFMWYAWRLHQQGGIAEMRWAAYVCVQVCDWCVCVVCARVYANDSHISFHEGFEIAQNVILSKKPHQITIS